MNESDAERLATVLEKNNYRKTKEIKEANLVALVSCSVRQMAIDRVYGLIRNIKKENKKTKIIVTGCLPEKDKKKLAKEANLVFPIKDLPRLTHKILELNNQKLKNDCDYLKIKPNYSTFPIAHVPIMTGCNNFCTYCVVPYTRGPEVSRPANEILREVSELIKKDYKMIVLLGQNVNSYKSQNSNSKFQIKPKTQIPNSKFENNSLSFGKNSGETNFPELLRMINGLPGNFWLTFLSSHPKDFSNELIKAMTQCNKLMSYLHLPVQAGDDEVLHHMNRHYTASHYKNLISTIRDKFMKVGNSPITISTDIIVGFPGETKKQFANTAKLMREVKFDMAYLARYSPRPGTAAWKLPNNVSAQEKKKRWQTLNSILKKTGLENNKKYLNKITEVLILKQKEHYFLGQSKSFKNIKITVDQLSGTTNIIIGQFVKVKIENVTAWGLEGEIV